MNLVEEGRGARRATVVMAGSQCWKAEQRPTRYEDMSASAGRLSCQVHAAYCVMSAHSSERPREQGECIVSSSILWRLTTARTDGSLGVGTLSWKNRQNGEREGATVPQCPNRRRPSAREAWQQRSHKKSVG